MRHLLPLLIAVWVPPIGAQVAVERQVFAMGTSLRVAAGAATRPGALAAGEAAIRAVEQVEDRLSTWRDDSDVARIHGAAPGVPVAVAPETVAELRWAFAIAANTGFAFDPGVGALVDVFDLRGAGRNPSAGAIAAALAATGCRHFTCTDTAIVRDASGATLDLGACGKGIALARALAAARAAGAQSVQFDFGGQIAWWDRGDRELPVGLADPDDRARVVATVRMPPGTSLATSGNGERAHCVDGVRRGHLLDPRRGEFAADFGSVAVLARDPAMADAASTALFVLGPVHGPAVAASLGVDACFAVRDDRAAGGLRLLATRGLRDRLVSALPFEIIP